jgi:hypothetical protein
MRTGVSPKSTCLLAAAALAWAACAFAGDETAAFSIQSHDGARALFTPTWSLTISGQWPTHCPPTLENVALEGHNLRVDARTVLDLCERGTTPFSIELNPALALQRGLAPGVYHVSVYAADGAQSTPELRAFSLLDHGTVNAPAITPETGFWWSSNATDPNRSTFSIELQDGQLSVALLSYDEGGRAVWYFGAAPYSGRTAHLPLLRLAGGSAPFAQVSSAPHGDSALTLDVEFSSAAHASAWLTHEGDGHLQLQTLDLVRLPLEDSADGHAWQGDWVLVADSADTVPQRLHFDQFHAIGPANFMLNDSTANVTLTCNRKLAQPEWPPAGCSLRQGDGQSISFSSVALTRMDGMRADRTAIHLLRVTP